MRRIPEGDFGINRVGQRICCVWPMPIIDQDGTVFHEGPKVGAEYTVEQLLPCKSFDVDYLVPGAILRELDEVACKCCGDPLPWPLFIFRPVIADDSKSYEAIVVAAKKVTLEPKPDKLVGSPKSVMGWGE